MRLLATDEPPAKKETGKIFNRKQLARGAALTSRAAKKLHSSPGGMISLGFVSLKGA